MSDQFSSLNSNEDFEKVDPDSYAEQDENVTSSSMPGDMAEEDRYAANDQDDLLGDISGGGSVPGSTVPDVMSGQPLIEFDNGVPESTVTASAPAEPDFTEPKKETAPAVPSEGCWMKNVDPRDEDNFMSEPAITAMDEQPGSNAPADMSAAAAATGQPSREANGESQESPNIDCNKSKTELDSESSGEYSCEDYSSSVEESESENSDMESSENEGTYDMIPEQIENMEVDSLTEEHSDSVDILEINNTSDVDDSVLDGHNEPPEKESSTISDKVSETGVNVETDPVLETLPQELVDMMEVKSAQATEPNKQRVSDMFEKDEPSKNDNEVMSETVDLLSESEAVSENCVIQDVECADIKEVSESKDEIHHELDENFMSVKNTDEDNTERNTSIMLEDHNVEGLGANAVDMDKEATSEFSDEHENSVTDELENAVTESVSEEISQDTEEDSISEYRTMGMSEDEMSKLLEKLTSENEVECVDSVEKDKFLDNIEPPIFDKVSMSSLSNVDSSDESVGSESEHGDSSIDSDISGDEPVMGVWNPSPLHANLDSVSEENDSSDPAVDSVNLSGYTYLEDTDENIHKKVTKELAHNFDEDTDQCHVKFQSPTNTIFYDPESPIIERVSVQVSDDLNDNNDETRATSKEQEVNQPDFEDPCNLEMSEDTNEFRECEEERDAELQGAMELIQDTGLEELKLLASQIRGGNRSEPQKSTSEVLEKERLAEGQMLYPEDTDAEVVLRRKNHKNVVDEYPEYDRSDADSMIIHDADLPTELINEFERGVELIPSSNVDRDDVNSMIIHEEDSMLLTEAMSSLDKMIPDVEKAGETETLTQKNKVDQDTEDLDKVLRSNNEILEEIAETQTQHPDNKTDNLDKNLEVEQIEDLASKIASTIMDSVTTQSLGQNISNINEEGNIDDISHGESIGNNKETNADVNEPVSCFETSMETTMIEADMTHEPLSNIVPQEELVQQMVDEMEEAEAIAASISLEEVAFPAVYKERARSSFSVRAAAVVLELSSEVLEIIYWRDVKKTGVVFGSMMFVLLSLALCSLLSVMAYLSLAILTVTFSFRVYKSVMQAVQKTNEGHPFKKLLDLDIELREDVVQGAAQKIADNINNCSRELRRLYLVGDYLDSLKFGLLLWLMTYIGSWFNGMTLVILVVVSIFTLPKVYETYQGPIDQNVNLVRAQLNNIMAQVSAKIPFPKKKVKAQ